MRIKIYLDGEFTDEERKLTNEIEDNTVITWKMKTLPLKGDYVNLNAFVIGIPEILSEGNWLVEHRTFVDDETIVLYLMFRR